MAGSHDGRVWSDLLFVIGVSLFMAGLIIIYCAGSLCLWLISVCYDGVYFICFAVLNVLVYGCIYYLGRFFWLLGSIFWPP